MRCIIDVVESCPRHARIENVDDEWHCGVAVGGNGPVVDLVVPRRTRK